MQTTKKVVDFGHRFQPVTGNENEALTWQRGVVHWFDAGKAYGFIHAANGKDVFVHCSALQRNHVNTVDFRGGMIVEFTAKQRPNRACQEVALIRVVSE